MNPPPTASRNPGPSWGYSFLLWAERWWPGWFFRPMLMIGTWVGFAFMPAQRAHSRAYLAVVLGRPPRLIEVWRHFFAFAEFDMSSQIADIFRDETVAFADSQEGFESFFRAWSDRGIRGYFRIVPHTVDPQ